MADTSYPPACQKCDFCSTMIDSYESPIINVDDFVYCCTDCQQKHFSTAKPAAPKSPIYESSVQAVVLHCPCGHRSPVITRSLAVATKPAVCAKAQCGLTISPADS